MHCNSSWNLEIRTCRSVWLLRNKQVSVSLTLLFTWMTRWEPEIKIDVSLKSNFNWLNFQIFSQRSVTAVFLNNRILHVVFIFYIFRYRFINESDTKTQIYFFCKIVPVPSCKYLFHSEIKNDIAVGSDCVNRQKW